VSDGPEWTGDWIDPYAGFEYLEDEVEVSAVHQSEKLTACGIDAAVFADQVDPAFFIGIAIHAGIRSGITAQGNVNMLQSLAQMRPVLTGERLHVSGRITDVKTVPRGRTLHTSVSFADAQGAVVLRADRVSLKPEARAGEVAEAGGGAGNRPAPLVEDPSLLQHGARYALTPERVKAYSQEGNSIHYEEQAAKDAGFRAPLIGGGMGVHYLTAALWAAHRPEALLLDVYFRRPIFWDEEVTVAYDDLATPSVIALLKPAGSVGTEIAVRSMSV